MTSNLSDIRIGSVWVNVSQTDVVHAYDNEFLADLSQDNRRHKVKLVFGWTDDSIYTYIASTPTDGDFRLQNLTCRWTCDDVHGKWDTQCGTGFCYMEDGLAANSFVFCPCCGGHIHADVPTVL